MVSEHSTHTKCDKKIFLASRKKKLLKSDMHKVFDGVHT